MAVHLTLKKIPVNGALKDESGLPFACVVQPFAKAEDAPLIKPSAVRARDVGRCRHCFAYVNKYCSFQTTGWGCCLCGTYNEYRCLSNRRYARPPLRQAVPELRRALVEVQCDLDDEADSALQAEGGGAMEVAVAPVTLALVDAGGGEEWLELVRGALAAALEALPPTALFGLVTFGTQVELWDVRGPVPAVRCVALTPDGAAPTAVDLGDALPLSALLAPVGATKERIAAALDLLEPAQPGQPLGSRGFGSAMQAVLRYISAAGGMLPLEAHGGDRSTPASSPAHPAAPAADGLPSIAASLCYAGARVLAFLAGAPDNGRGAVLRAPPRPLPSASSGPPLFDPTFPDVNPYAFVPLAAASGRGAAAGADERAGEGSQWEVDLGARAFYEGAAAAAAALGVRVDVFAACAGPCGLEAVEPLASGSGGALLHYPHLEQAALPQDVYRRLSASAALGGLLRVRLSPELRVARAYGPLAADERYEDLAHVAACDAHTCFAFDLEFTSTVGCGDKADVPPFLQMAFQYSVVVPAGSVAGAIEASTGAEGEVRSSANGNSAGGNSGAGVAGGRVFQRRLRILTVPLTVARSVRDLYTSTDADAVLVMLAHKTARAAQEVGAREAGALLQDWLVLFAAAYNRSLRRDDDAGPTAASQVDVACEGAEALQPLARLAYALLCSPLLGEAPGAPAGGDAAVAARHLWAALPPGELRRAVYPALASYSDPDTQACALHSLSRAALTTAGAPVWLLDAFSQLVVYYAPTAPAGLPFPPPPSSALRRAINAIRASRRITPALHMLRGGHHDAEPFSRWLLEEPDTEAPAGTLGAGGFVAFLAQVQGEAYDYMREQGWC
ncbi:hypothetical protein WJX81_008153 [Elliptochloris bilobata]|uniref:Protein transport protein SEC23 n=1 Tax=Elliptochloris bilobata TaxID=381761 RepID=A0AAW1RDU5_9CHLO